MVLVEANVALVSTLWATTNATLIDDSIRMLHAGNGPEKNRLKRWGRSVRKSQVSSANSNRPDVIWASRGQLGEVNLIWDRLGSINKFQYKYKVIYYIELCTYT
jgi:hypothetical protein